MEDAGSRVLLEVDNLVCGYDKREVLREVSFQVESGDLLGIVGPNSAGKTTLFRTIIRVIRPWRGKILYRGKALEKISQMELAKEVAVLPQVIEIPFPFTVSEFVAMGRFPHLRRFERLKGHDLEAIDRAMELADILHLQERRINELSGGERQRAVLAQGFAQEPRLLLLDEPTSHLDIGHQVEILDMIRKLNREWGLTVIMVLHDLNIASEYCDRLILFKEGKIFKTGLPRDVLTYRNIEEVYKTVVLVDENPISSKPHIFLVSKEEGERVRT